jgi:hypothetical protein
LMSSCKDFVEEETMLQSIARDLGVHVDRMPKCHCELAGEGIEYAWAWAKFCIAKDYLGPNPSFGPDELKRIFRVSRQNYDGLRNYLCHVQTFFHDGVDATRWTKISSDANIMIALKYLAYGIC